MRLRRLAGHDHDIDDVNNGRRHELAFTKIIERKGTLDEALLQQESYAPGVKGKLVPNPAGIKALVESLPTAMRGIRTGKMRNLAKLIPGVHPKLPGDAQEHVKSAYAHAEEHRQELNLYLTGEEEALEEEAPEPTPEPLASAVGGGGQDMDKITEGGSETAGQPEPVPEADLEPEPDEEGDREWLT